MSWRLTVSLFALVLALFSSWPTRAGDAVQILETSVNYTFGVQITFTATIAAGIMPERVQLFFQPEDELNAFVDEASLSGNALSYVYDLSIRPISAFSEVAYWFGFSLPGGETFVSEKYTFSYVDNRFDWQTLENGPYGVHWYAGDLSIGQMVLDTVQAGVQQAHDLINVADIQHVDIYVYATNAEMQSSLRIAGLKMVGGHASPDLGVVVVSLPDDLGQRLEAEQKVPHELMHILLYQTFGRKYENLPTWLNEGLASLAERFPNPDYEVSLRNAVEAQALIPMTTLCHGFPLDASSFYLSYAQSESFTRFIYRQYGSSGLDTLLASYSDGVDCNRGAELALGKPLPQLEARWQREVSGGGGLTRISAANPLLPYLIIMAIVVTGPLLYPILIAIFRQVTRKKTSPHLKDAPHPTDAPYPKDTPRPAA